MGVSASLEGGAFQEICHTVLLGTDAYADVRTRHHHVSSTRGDALSSARWPFSLGSCERKGSLSDKAGLRTEAAF